MLRKNEKEHKPEKNEDFSFLLYKLLFLVFLILIISFLKFPDQFLYKVVAQDSPLSENNDLSSIEEKVFHQKYETDSTEERFSRLENLIFGAKQSSGNTKQRLNKIINSFKTKDTTPKPLPTISNEIIKIEKEEPKVIVDESSNTGVIGAINQLEIKVFNMTFNELPFPARIENLEDKLFPKSEITKIRKKTIIERISILVNKAGANIPQQAAMFQSYAFDPKTGFLINEQTGEILKDNYGNQVVVMLPQAFFQQQLPLPNLPGQLQNNSFQLPGQNPYLQQLYGQGQQPFGTNQLPPQQQLGAPGQLPTLDLFNQGLDLGEPGY